MPSSGDGPFPVVLICHENRGLTAHIRDVARRWAAQGYVAAAVDLLSREGGTASIADPAEIPALLSDDTRCSGTSTTSRPRRPITAQENADAARLGMTGFCFGGGITCAATQMPELKARAVLRPAAATGGCPEYPAAVFGVYSDDPEDFATKGVRN